MPLLPPMLVFCQSHRAPPQRPDLRLFPPARSGDLIRALAFAPRAIVLVDTAFDRGPQPCLEELCRVLETGSTELVGVGGMGAIWAQDLQAQGMRGHGRLFDMIGRGEIADYHELCSPEAATPSLAELVCVLKEAADQQRVSPSEAEAVSSAVAARPVAERNMACLVAALQAHLRADVARQVETLCRTPQHLQGTRDLAGALDRLRATAPPPPQTPARHAPTQAASAIWMSHQCLLRDGARIVQRDVLDQIRLHAPDAADLHAQSVALLLARAGFAGPEAARTFAETQGLLAAPLLQKDPRSAPPDLLPGRPLEGTLLEWIRLRPECALDALALELIPGRPDFEDCVSRQRLVDQFNAGFDHRNDFNPEWLEETEMTVFYARVWGLPEGAAFDRERRLRGFHTMEAFRRAAVKHYVFDRSLSSAAARSP